MKILQIHTFLHFQISHKSAKIHSPMTIEFKDYDSENLFTESIINFESSVCYCSLQRCRRILHVRLANRKLNEHGNEVITVSRLTE